jgi:antitoxin component YwqK of YwqJK toxin-antitoxin module
MKNIATFALLVMAVVSPLLAQDQYKRRLGPFLIFGPVHINRDERATIINKNGELVEGPRILVQTVTYNEDGTKQEHVSYGPDGSITHKRIDVYDPDGRLLETTSFNRTELESRRVRNYDGHKELIEEISYRLDGSISDRITFVRRGSQRVIEAVSYDEHGVIRSKSTTIVDEQTNRSEGLTDDGSRVIQNQSTFNKTPEGGTITERRNDENPPRHEVFITNGKNGEETIRYNPDGTILSRERHTHEFDSYGNPIKTVRSFAKGNSSVFERFDVTYRTIEYYGKD